MELIMHRQLCATVVEHGAYYTVSCDEFLR